MGNQILHALVEALCWIKGLDDNLVGKLELETMLEEAIEVMQECDAERKRIGVIV